MNTYGIIGYPLSHSFSQRYFQKKFAEENIEDAVFNNYAIENIGLLKNILANTENFKGFCITIPYKKEIISFLSQSTDAVKQMGACNCVKLINEQMHGFNTDVIGFEKPFSLLLQPHHTKALVLGSGGAAAAIIFVLEKLKLPYQLVSRKASANAVSYEQLSEQLMQQHQIIINCTPLGTYPNADEAPPIPYQYITPQHYLFDLVYNPPLTKFLKLGEQQGAVIKNGYDMLVIQAEENWKIWNE